MSIAPLARLKLLLYSVVILYIFVLILDVLLGNGVGGEGSPDSSAQPRVAEEVVRKPCWTPPEGDEWRVGFAPLDNGSTITATQGVSRCFRRFSFLAAGEGGGGMWEL